MVTIGALFNYKNVIGFGWKGLCVSFLVQNIFLMCGFLETSFYKPANK